MTVIETMRSSLANFAKVVAPYKFVVGTHTRAICNRLDQAYIDYKKGKSSFIRIAIHPRAGKSELVARFFPLRLMLENDNFSTMVVSYSQDLVSKHSNFLRGVVSSNKIIRSVYPNLSIPAGGNKEKVWRLSNGSSYRAVSTNGQITGDGANLIIIDDFVKSAEELRNPEQRDKLWERFSDVIMPRWTGKAVIIVIIATQWHEDDIHGRISELNNPKSEHYKEKFPKFDFLRFPARTKAGSWLFSHDEHGNPNDIFSAEKYMALQATTSNHGWQAQYMCNPIPEGGYIFNVDKVKILSYRQFYDKLATFTDSVKWVRSWDFAHTDEEKGKDSDYTGTTKACIISQETQIKGLYAYFIFIAEYEQKRLGTIARNDWIRQKAREEHDTLVLFENTIDSMDSVAELLDSIHYSRAVSVNAQNKKARAELLTPSFDKGRVFLLNDDFNDLWINSFKRFDGSGKTHDEAIDNLSTIFLDARESRSTIFGGAYRG